MQMIIRISEMKEVLLGSRAVINKADVGMIMARPTKEELDILKDIIAINGLIPNIVTDIYKVRSGTV